MPQQVTYSVENNFTKGLITESTGLNFPENAATDCDNCEFTLVGEVTRRLGIDIENNGIGIGTFTTNKATSTYIWNNVSGNGNTKFLVRQTGGNIHFYNISASTVTNPLSTQYITFFDITGFIPQGGSYDDTKECQFADGNGFLFIFHPSIEPVYCDYSSGTVNPHLISVRVRDFTGIPETYPVDFRPTSLTDSHTYNLANQGWTTSPAWSATSTSTYTPSGAALVSFQVPAGIVGITVGQQVGIYGQVGLNANLHVNMTGTVNNYFGTTLIINVTYISGVGVPYTAYNNWTINPTNTGYLSTWFSAEGNYPSNADVWWYFKNNSGVFDPATTQQNVTLATGNAPRGHFVFNAFNISRSAAAGLPNITDLITLERPRTGAWFQGRVWYTGVEDFHVATATAGFYSWSENIYFSQVSVGDDTNFGNCFQTNDPTSENLNDILPTDGGVIQIQGSGPVYKLFPTNNGLLVFATNGIWFITGSQGIGFAANDYTITKISSVQTISASSFVNVMGLPYFWNEEGIYKIVATQTGMTVEPITVGTILSFYEDIPKDSKFYVRGDYNPIDYVIKWVYRSTNSFGISDRYHFDKVLNYNVYNKAFYPYTISEATNASVTQDAFVTDVKFISYPFEQSNTPQAGWKYPFVYLNNQFSSFAEEIRTNYLDWNSSDFSSYFITGYKLRGQAIRKFQPQYIQMWSKLNGVGSFYKIQGLWDYAIDRNSNRWSSVQHVDIPNSSYFSNKPRRHRIRGSGYALQIKVMSQTGLPFDIVGWAIMDTVNAGV